MPSLMLSLGTLREGGAATLCERRRRAAAGMSQASSLSALLERYHRFRCKDPRDVVYAIQSLMDQKDLKLKVDYAKDVSEIFIDTIYSIARYESKLPKISSASRRSLQSRWDFAVPQPLVSGAMAFGAPWAYLCLHSRQGRYLTTFPSTKYWTQRDRIYVKNTRTMEHRLTGSTPGYTLSISVVAAIAFGDLNNT